MTKQKLKFKVDGGLQKLSEFYTAAEKDERAAESYWQNPSALLEALEVSPAKEIRISDGYKKLAETLDKIEFDKWHGTFDRMKSEEGMSLQENAFTSLWQAVSGADPASLQLSRLGEDFGQAFTMMMTMTITVTITMTITITVTSGHRNEQEKERVPSTPGGPKFASAAELATMARYAQNVAEQIGWFS